MHTTTLSLTSSPIVLPPSIKTVAVISDSHGDIKAVRRALSSRAFDAVFFLGDGAQEAIKAAHEKSLPIVAVRGNNDPPMVWGVELKTSAIVVFSSQRLFLTHGHKFHLSTSANALLRATADAGANTCLFGHLHVALDKSFNGVRLLNPGSIFLPRDSYSPSFATLKDDLSFTITRV